MDLKNFIQVYDNVIEDSFADQIVNVFDRANSKYYEDEFQKAKHYYLRDEVDIIEKIYNIFDNFVAQHNNFSWPQNVGWEQIRIKKYEIEEQMSTHVDVFDHASAKRFISFQIYLTDVKVGGETEFPTLDTKIKCKKGRLVMFPPFWMFPHKGNPPISNPKYLLGSYLHYL